MNDIVLLCQAWLINMLKSFWAAFVGGIIFAAVFVPLGLAWWSVLIGLVVTSRTFNLPDAIILGIMLGWSLLAVYALGNTSFAEICNLRFRTMAQRYRLYPAFVANHLLYLAVMFYGVIASLAFTVSAYALVSHWHIWMTHEWLHSIAWSVSIGLMAQPVVAVTAIYPLVRDYLATDEPNAFMAA